MVVVSLTRLPQCSTKRRSRTLSLRWENNKNLGVSSSKSGIAVFLAWPLQNRMINIRFEIQGWEFTLQDSSQVSNSLGWPAYQWMPDGHLSTLWVGLSSSSCLLYPYLPQLPPDLIDCIYPIQLFINKWTDDSLKTFRWTELNNGCCFTRIPTHIVVCKNTLWLL